MGGQTLEPPQLVVELWPGRGIAVWKIQTSDDESINACFNVATVDVIGVAGQSALRFDRITSSRDSTWRSLAVGLREDNPVVAATLHSGSFPLFALVKVALVVALGIVLLGGRPVALTGTRLVVVTFCLIAIGNLISVLSS